jgi:site-specific DNA-methyltransferase (adenine-specific)
MSLPKPYYDEGGITIFHGDCRTILPHLAPVDLVLTDPPYGENQATWDSRKPTDEVWDLMVSRMREGAALYYWGFWGHADWVLSNARRVGLTPQSQLTWWFQTGRPEKKSYREDTESAWYFSLGEPSTFNCQDDLEPYGDEANYARYGREGKHPGTVWIASRIFHNHPENVGHETQKPLTVISKIVRISSNESETILDPFMGSGTTLRAAKDLGRKAIGIEIEEKYCEIAAKRLAQEVLPL